MSMNPIFLVCAAVVIFAFLASIFGKKGATLIIGTIVLFGYILNQAF